MDVTIHRYLEQNYTIRLEDYYLIVYKTTDSVIHGAHLVKELCEVFEITKDTAMEEIDMWAKTTRKHPLNLKEYWNTSNRIFKVQRQLGQVENGLTPNILERLDRHYDIYTRMVVSIREDKWYNKLFKWLKGL